MKEISIHGRGGQGSLVLAQFMAIAALEDEKERKPFSDVERFVAYLDKPWSGLEPYLDNLSDGSMEFESSLIAEGLERFERTEARELLEQAKEPFTRALQQFKEGKMEEACELLVESSALWTHATWKEFLEEEVIGSNVPKAYRPIAEKE